MTFTSLNFYLFLPVVYLVFYFTSDRWRWFVLLVASYGFYAFFKAPYLIAVLFMVTCISYACGLRIGSRQDEASRKHWLWVGVIACIVILVLLKYFPFLATRTDSVFGLHSTLSNSIISIGVSYFVLHAISYLIDIYLDIEKPEHHFGYFALYLSFFPKLVQGPIERACDLLPQLRRKYEFNYESMRSGMLLFTWGLLKKLVVADRLAHVVNSVYNDVHAYNGLPLILATYMYAFQIYFDFSAYTDMALGTAKMFNITLTQNFNKPYLAQSISDFWRRWHISFSRWILDYIFKPLQMQWRNWGYGGTAIALLVTFLVSGVWHGASCGFLIWGLIHGIYLASSVLYKPFQTRLYKLCGIHKSITLRVWQTILTFNMVCFSWVFFRANTIEDAFYIIMHLTTGVYVYFSTLLHNINNFAVVSGLLKTLLFGSSKADYGIIVSAIGIITIVNISKGHVNINTLPLWLRWTAYYLLIITILLCGDNSTSNFIYYQF